MTSDDHSGAHSDEKPRLSSDPAYVRTQYRSPDNLSVRIRTHELYSEFDVDFAAWVLDSIGWRGDETVLDVGCGAGFYIDAVRQRARQYIAGDLSPGMLRDLEAKGVMRLNLDAQQLPIGRQSVDVILANHMLYHVPDIDRALAQFRRALKGQGKLLAATNSRRSMAELQALENSILRRLGSSMAGHFRSDLTFTMENGDSFLRRHFTHVEQRLHYNALVFAEAQPVVDYVASSIERLEGMLPPGASWPDIADLLRAAVKQKIRRYGEFRVNKLSGVFIAWNE